MKWKREAPGVYVSECGRAKVERIGWGRKPWVAFYEGRMVDAWRRLDQAQSWCNIQAVKASA